MGKLSKCQLAGHNINGHNINDSENNLSPGVDLLSPGGYIHVLAYDHNIQTCLLVNVYRPTAPLVTRGIV